MNLYNIKDNSEQVSFAQAVRQGLGREQGLFFPEQLEALADGLVQQRGHHRGIHAAGQAQDHFVVADLFAHPRDLVLDDVRGGPERLAAADVDHEAAQQGLALAGMGHFRMELHPVPAARIVGEGGHRDAVGLRGDLEARRRYRDVVAVAHPHVQPRRRAGMVLQAFEQPVGRHQRDGGVAEFALVGRLGGPAQLHGHGLHAVADAQDRHP